MKTKVKFLVHVDPKPDPVLNAVFGAPDVYAYFPEENHDREGIYKTCYAHIGQHSAIHPDYAQESRNATEEERKELIQELKSIGYVLEILN